jgi:uncharacterized surface protein with fasciclin (FAS1) repeats
MRKHLSVGLAAALCTALPWPAFADECPAAARRTIVAVAASAGSFKTLTNALVAADLVDALKSEGPFTVFAPTDAAFAKLPSGVLEKLLKPENRDQLAALLKYHVVAARLTPAEAKKRGSVKTLAGPTVTLTVEKHRLKVNDSVVQAEVGAANGQIFVIDTVLTPPAADEAKAAPAATLKILGVADKAGQFKTLIAAVKAAHLSETLDGPGPFTVFAPTDAAFAKLPEGTVEKLLRPENRQRLAEVLKYHVVSGKISARDLLVAGGAKTLQGAPVKADLVEGRLTVNTSKVLSTDLKAANGIIHVIDGVLLPPE